MSATPVPSHAETRANATYEALMWALSRPGLIRDLPAPGPELIVEALIDRECQVHCEEVTLAAQVTRTGAALVDVEQADHVFLGAAHSADVLKRLSQGSDLHPEDGATLVLPVRLGEGAALRLSGPGIETTETVTLGGLPDGFWQMRADIMRYPQGFELFLLDGARVLGVPRTTIVEAL